MTRNPEAGTTLIETLVACALLAIVITGLAGMVTMSSTITENQGHLSARTAEYSVDKMEQLLQLTYGDTQSDSTQFPSVSSGGTGLTPGGSISAPAVGYTDYLDVNGKPLCNPPTGPCTATAPTGWYYQRTWQVTLISPPDNLKQITVSTTIKSSVGNAIKSQTSVTAMKTNCPMGC